MPSRRSRHAHRLALLCLLALAACGGDGGGPVDPGPNDPGPHGPREPDPIAVSPTADASRAVEAVVGPNGGTLTATGADGSTYVLAVPPGALAFEQRIRMTPLATVGGIPLGGGLEAGVALEPDGLWLLQAATLHIATAQPVAAATAVGFAYEGDGQEFRLTPVQAAGPIVSLDVLHFSGHGVSTASPAEVAAQASHVPTTVTARVEQDAAVAAHGDPTPAPATMGDVLDRAYAEAEPMVRSAEAGTDLVAFREAVQTMLNISRMSQLFGDPNGSKYNEEAMRLFIELNRRILEYSWSRCVHQNDVSAIPDILTAYRQGQLLGFTDELPAGYFEGCLRFELDFDSRLDVDATVEETRAVTTVTTAVDQAVLTFDMASARITGSGPHRHLGISATVSGGNPCRLDYSNLTDATFNAVALEFTMEGSATDDGIAFGQKATIKDVAIVFEPGEPGESQTTTCPGAPPITTATQMWPAFFAVLHQGERPLPEFAGYGKSLSRGQGAHFAFTAWNRTVDCSNEGTVGSCTEATTLTVYHRPQVE